MWFVSIVPRDLIFTSLTVEVLLELHRAELVSTATVTDELVLEG